VRASPTNPDSDKSGGGADVHRISEADLTAPNLCGNRASVEGVAPCVTRGLR
jgi:hypothetical protein